ncbi:MAG: glycosyltransferase family 2 protein [Thiotrichaceae bacterium]
MATVCIILLNWQNGQDTLACLNSLIQLDSSIDFSIIVCDNDSQDDSVAQITHWAQQHFPQDYLTIPPTQNAAYLGKNLSNNHAKLTLIQTGSNLGFAGGNNVGIRYALTNPTCEYLWILNNDTTVAQNALETLYTCAQQRPHIALFGSTIVDFYRPTVVQCAGGCRYFPWLTRFQNVWGEKSLDFVSTQSETEKLDYIYGASMFLRVAAVRQVGLLNEEYFLFYEELDYTRRLAQHGQTIGWCKLSLVYHKCSATIGQPQQNDQTKLQRANYYENLSTLKYTKNFHPYQLIWVLPFRFTIKSLLFMMRRQLFLFPSLLAAYRDFLITRGK